VSSPKHQETGKEGINLGDDGVEDVSGEEGGEVKTEASTEAKVEAGGHETAREKADGQEEDDNAEEGEEVFGESCGKVEEGSEKKRERSLLVILAVAVALVGGLPCWRRGKSWGGIGGRGRGSRWFWILMFRMLLLLMLGVEMLLKLLRLNSKQIGDVCHERWGSFFLWLLRSSSKHLRQIWIQLLP